MKNRFDKLALAGGAPAVRAKAPDWPVVGNLEAAWMEAVVRSGKWSWMGPHETAFCSEFSSFTGSRHCLCLANGTVTLQCALQAVGVRPGDEVIVPGLTWVATAQAALDVGAEVVLADINPETLCLDPASFEKEVTSRTRAVIPVHLYGCMCDMDAIMEIAQRKDIKVVEDAAHQHGGRWRNRSAGAIGDAGSFSFQQSKVLTCGEGGAVICDDDEVYRIVHCLKQVGWGPDNAPGNEYGHNYRMTEMQAVLLRGGLKRLPEQTWKREDAAAYISEALEIMGGPLRVVPRDPRVTTQAYYALTLLYEPGLASGLGKKDYCEALAAEGCAIGKTYEPVYANPLMNLHAPTSPLPYRNREGGQNFREFKLPGVEQAVGETALVLSHNHLLGDKNYLDQWLAGVEKVNGKLSEAKKIIEERNAAAQ